MSDQQAEPLKITPQLTESINIYAEPPMTTVMSWAIQF